MTKKQERSTAADTIEIPAEVRAVVVKARTTSEATVVMTLAAAYSGELFEDLLAFNNLAVAAKLHETAAMHLEMREATLSSLRVQVVAQTEERSPGEFVIFKLYEQYTSADQFDGARAMIGAKPMITLTALEPELIPAGDFDLNDDAAGP